MATLKNTNINDTGYLHLPALRDGGATNIYSMGGVTLSNSARGLGVARNALQLYIGDTGSTWEKYQNLPPELEGMITTLNINDSANITITLDAPATIYLLRYSGWSGVSTTGWTTIFTDYNFASLISGYGTVWELYRQDFAAGTYNFDNYSAMYLISLGEAGELRYNEGVDSLEFYHQPNPDERGRWQRMRIPYPVRQVITTNYVVGGYKNSSAWSNANRTVDSTDTTTNLGDGRIRAFNYQPGANSRDNMFVFGAGGGHAVTSNYVSSFSMRTETERTHENKWDLARSDHLSGSIWQEQRKAWANNGGTLQFFDLVTETAGADGPASTSDTWGMSSENYGLLWTGDGGTQKKFTFATSTMADRGGTFPSSQHQQKTVHSKWNYQHAGNEGSYAGGNNLRQTNQTNDTTSGTVGKPVTNSGEENFGMGQNWQYMLGMFNGLQNNISWRFNYATEEGFQGGSTMEPKGHDGMSSAWNGWRD